MEDAPGPDSRGKTDNTRHVAGAGTKERGPSTVMESDILGAGKEKWEKWVPRKDLIKTKRDSTLISRGTPVPSAVCRIRIPD